MDGIPERTPRGRPNARITTVNLNTAVIVEILLNLEDRSPEDRFGCDIFSKPEGNIGVIFSFEDSSKKGISVSSYIPSCSDDEAAVDMEKVSNTKPPIIFRLADVVPRSKVKGRRISIFLNTSPPKSSNDGGDFPNESFREEHSGHIVNRDRSKN